MEFLTLLAIIAAGAQALKYGYEFWQLAEPVVTPWLQSFS